MRTIKLEWRLNFISRSKQISYLSEAYFTQKKDWFICTRKWISPHPADGFTLVTLLPMILTYAWQHISPELINKCTDISASQIYLAYITNANQKFVANDGMIPIKKKNSWKQISKYKIGYPVLLTEKKQQKLNGNIYAIAADYIICGVASVSVCLEWNIVFATLHQIATFRYEYLWFQFF